MAPYTCKNIDSVKNEHPRKKMPSSRVNLLEASDPSNITILEPELGVMTRARQPSTRQRCHLISQGTGRPDTEPLAPVWPDIAYANT